MTTRRKFIKGAVSAAVAASLPGGDGVALYSAKHPEYTYQTFDFATHGARMAQALAHSMMQTAKENILIKEIVARNVLNAVFEEIEIDIPE